MSITQISKIQQRSGNLVDLPQLDDAELGWANDAKRLFIGNETPSENVEVLTSYSEIDFNQIVGSVGNLSITDPQSGQILSFDGTNWINKGGTANGLITLGDVSNVKISGGAIGYTLETDGLGNLSWVPKGTLLTNIIGLSNTNPIIMTVANTTPYTNDTEVTITGVVGTGNTIVNGQSFYVRLENDYPTSGNVRLYTDPNEVGPVDGTTLDYTNSPNAIATSSTIGSGGGIAVAGGTTYSVQYNDNNLSEGDSDFTWNFNTKVLNVSGNITTGNVAATGTISSSRFVSNVATGTSPLTVASTTKVTNLNADLLDGYDTSISSSANTVVVRNTDGNIAGNNFSGTSFTATGSISGNTLESNIATGTSPLTVASTTKVTNLNADLLDGYDTSISSSANTVVVRNTDGNIAGNNFSATNNITIGGYNIRSVATGISAAGTTQGDATTIDKDINVVSTVSTDQGVVLPTAVAGMTIIINNTSANTVRVYPATGAQIGTLGTNIHFSHVSGASLQYYAVSSTQWYTVGATYA